MPDTNDLPPSARRVHDALADAGVSADIVHHEESTRTAEEAAAACGCATAQIVKSLIFAGKETGDPVLLLVAGDNRVHERRTGRAIGEPIGRADADLVRKATGFAIGGVPPLGHPRPIRTYVDETLLGYDEVWAAAGTPNHVFAIAPAELVRVTGAQVISVT